MCGDAEKVLLLTPRTVVNAARFYSGAASRAEDSCTAEAYRSSEGWVFFCCCFCLFVCFANALPCTRVLSTLLAAVFSAVCSHAGSCHSSCAQHFVCIPAPLLHIRPALWRLVSVRASDAALPHLTPPSPSPRPRPPRQALSPAPLLASSRRAIANEIERMKKKNRIIGQW